MGLTAAEEQELAQLQSKYAPKSKGLSPLEEEELADLQNKYGMPLGAGYADVSAEQKAKNAQAPLESLEDMDLVEGGARALDYPGGLVRTGAAGLMGVANEDDFSKALHGQAPSSAQYLERGGVSPGFTIPKDVPLVGGVTGRDVEGFALDVGSDPLTLASKAMRGLRPAGKGIEKAGESMYKSGLKNVDKELVEKGKKPVADLLFKERKTGSMAKLSKDAEQIGDRALKDRGTLYQEASDAGAVVDMTAAVKGARSKLREMRANPGMRATADKLEEFLNKYEGEGFADIQSVSDWKSALYDSLPESAFNNGRIKGPAKAFEKVLARDFKMAIESAADEVSPGLGKKISSANEKMGTVLSAKKPMAREVRKAETPNNFTQVDAMWSGLGALGGGMAGGSIGAPLGFGAAYGVKNAAKAMNTTGGRTRGGLLLKDVGASGLVDSTARQGLIKSAKKKKNDKRD